MACHINTWLSLLYGNWKPRVGCVRKTLVGVVGEKICISVQRWIFIDLFKKNRGSNFLQPTVNCILCNLLDCYSQPWHESSNWGHNDTMSLVLHGVLVFSLWVLFGSIECPSCMINCVTVDPHCFIYPCFTPD